MSSGIAQYYRILVARRATAAVTNKADCKVVIMQEWQQRQPRNLQTAALDACSDNALNTLYGQHL